MLDNNLRQKLFMPNARAEMQFVLVGELLSCVVIFGLERAVKYLHLLHTCSQCVMPC